MAFETQVETGAHRNGAADARLKGFAGGDGLRATLGLAVAVTVFQIFQGLNSDSSWLLTVAEHWLDGARVYADILESNPPSSFLPLAPAALLGRLAGLAPEPIIIALTAFTAFLVGEITVRTLIATGVVESPARTRLALAFSLLVLPISIFAEREHMGVIALVPLWALTLLRAEKRAIPSAFLIAAGIGGGLLPAAAVARYRRDFTALLLPEYWIAAAVVGLFGLMTLAFFPAYAKQMVPIVLDLYRPVREPMIFLLLSEPVRWSALALLGLGLLGRGRLTAPRLAIPLLAMLGAGLGVLEQGKGFAYHYYPMVAALGLVIVDQGIGLANARFSPGTTRSGRPMAVIGFLMMVIGLAFATLYFYGIAKPMAPLVAPIERLAPHPRLMALTPHFWVGHPLVHDVGGTWVGSVPTEWMTLGALYKLGLHPASTQEAQRLEAIIEADKARFAADIAKGGPDIIVVEHDDRVFPAWFGSDEDLARFLTGYTRAFTAFGMVDVWSRSPR
jgi:hypothetical protein